MNGKQSPSGLKVRDMVRLYDTALKSESVKPSYSSIGSSKSSYFGLNARSPVPEDNFGLNARSPLPEDDFEDLYADYANEIVQEGSPRSPSRSSNGSQKTLRKSRSPRLEDFNALLDTQKSFMNLSRSRESPKAAPREKRPRNSSLEFEPPQLNEEKLNKSDVSYHSKTTISKTPNGVRIIVDIFFDQNKCVAIEDVVGSRIETDIPPSKILKEFQKRVAETSQY